MIDEPIVVDSVQLGARVFTVRGRAQWSQTPVILGVPYRQVTHIATTPGDCHDGVDLGFGRAAAVLRFSSPAEALEQVAAISQKMDS